MMGLKKILFFSGIGYLVYRGVKMVLSSDAGTIVDGGSGGSSATFAPATPATSIESASPTATMAAASSSSIVPSPILSLLFAKSAGYFDEGRAYLTDMAYSSDMFVRILQSPPVGTPYFRNIRTIEKIEGTINTYSDVLRSFARENSVEIPGFARVGEPSKIYVHATLSSDTWGDQKIKEYLKAAVALVNNELKKDIFVFLANSPMIVRDSSGKYTVR